MDCIIHIGTEKTGTTLLQRWLYLNRSNLMQQGIFLSKCIDEPNNRKLCAFFQNEFDDFFLDKKITNSVERSVYFQGFLEELSGELSEAKKTYHTCILTSEHFSSRLQTYDEIRNLKIFLYSIFSNVKIICYVREQSQLRLSSYSTALRVNSKISIDEFALNINADHYYYNYYKMLSNWADVFGSKSINVSIFESSLFVEGDLRKDFIQKCGCFRDIDNLNFTLERANEAISLLQSSIIRIINTAHSRYDDRGNFNQIGNLLVTQVLENTNLKFGKIPNSLGGEIYDKFDEVNRSFFDKFFNEKRNLFIRPKTISEISNFDLSKEKLSKTIEEVILMMVTIMANVNSSNTSSNVPNLMLNDSAVDLFRDIALKYKSKKVVSQKEACKLMSIAKIARPNGPVINKFLEKYKDD